MAQADLIVRTKLAKLADRQAFDDRYRLERLRDAVKGVRALRGWRNWSRTNLLVHFAVYEFSTTDEAEAAVGSPAFDALVAEFDRIWGTRAEPTREKFETAGDSDRQTQSESSCLWLPRRRRYIQRRSTSAQNADYLTVELARPRRFELQSRPIKKRINQSLKGDDLLGGHSP
jgi:hypothetical protein